MSELNGKWCWNDSNVFIGKWISFWLGLWMSKTFFFMNEGLSFGSFCPFHTFFFFWHLQFLLCSYLSLHILLFRPLDCSSLDLRHNSIICQQLVLLKLKFHRTIQNVLRQHYESCQVNDSSPAGVYKQSSQSKRLYSDQM